jgi:hypothetical protein
LLQELVSVRTQPVQVIALLAVGGKLLPTHWAQTVALAALVNKPQNTLQQQTQHAQYALTPKRPLTTNTNMHSTGCGQTRKHPTTTRTNMRAHTHTHTDSIRTETKPSDYLALWSSMNNLCVTANTVGFCLVFFFFLKYCSAHYCADACSWPLRHYYIHNKHLCVCTKLTVRINV